MKETNGAATYPPRMQKSFSKLAHDALDLAELQVKLLKVETAAAGRILWSALILAAIGFASLFAALPIALLAIAEFLVESEWSRMEALAAVAAGGLVVSAIAIGLGSWKLKKCLSAWQRSSEELSRNVKWIKSTLKNDDHLSMPPARNSFH